MKSMLRTFRFRNPGMALLAILTFLSADLALAHKNQTQLAVGFSANPVAAGTPVTITGTLTYTGTFAPGSATGHPIPFPADGDPVVGETVQIQQKRFEGAPVPCSAGGAFVEIASGNTDAAGQFPTLFDTTGLGGSTIGFRALHPGGGGAHGAAQSSSPCADLIVLAATTSTISISPNPIGAGTDSTITAETKVTATEESVSGGLLKIQRAVDGYGKHVACEAETPFNDAAQENPTDGHLAITEGSGLDAGTYGYRANYLPEGSGFAPSQSACADLVVTGSTSQGIILYLHNNPTPPLGDTNMQGNLPLSATEPAATTLYNYDKDRDSFAGRRIQKGGSDNGHNETDLVKYQNWRTAAAPVEGLVLEGTIPLTLFSGMKDFPSNESARTKRGFVGAFLRDCPAPSSLPNACTLIATASLSRSSWHGNQNTWMEDTINFQVATSYTVLSGSSLEIKIVVHSDSDDDMWFAYDTVDHPAKLTLP